MSVASRRTRGPIDKISFGAPFWPVTNHSRSDSSLFEPGFEVDPSGEDGHTAAVCRHGDYIRCNQCSEYGHKSRMCMTSFHE